LIPRGLVVLGAGLLLAAAAGASDAPTPDPAASSAPAMDGAMLFQIKTCFTCHGPDAKTPLLPEYPKLAGQNAPYLLRQMTDIKSGARSNGQTAAMKGIMVLVSDGEMPILAEHISTLQP
jgi:cytochrome c